MLDRLCGIDNGRAFLIFGGTLEVGGPNVFKKRQLFLFESILFPTRNDALARKATQPEMAFVADGGYRKALEMVGAA